MPASLPSVPALVTTDKGNSASERWESGRSPHPLPHHLLQNASRVKNIHTVKGIGIVNKAEIDAFLELSCFLDDPADVGKLISSKKKNQKFIFRIGY